MQLYFSTDDKFYSKFFRFIFKEPVSHIGVGFFKDGMDLVVDGTKPFGKLYSGKHWRKKYRVLYFLDIKMSKEDEKEALKLVSDYAILKEYDWGAYYYGFLVGIRRFLIRKPLPLHNKWQERDKLLCTEVLQPLKKLLEKYDVDIKYLDLSAFTPHMLGRYLYKKWWPEHKHLTWPEGTPNG